MDDQSVIGIMIFGGIAGLIIQYFIIKTAIKAALTETGLAKSEGTSQQQGQYPPGWYVDPRDQTIERYYDGAWTGSTRPRTQQT